MFFGWMCFNSVFYGLLTWMPNYLHMVHGFDIKQMGGSSFIIFFSGFVGELIGGWIADKWKAAGGRPNVVMRTLFGIAAVIATVSIFSVAYVTNPVAVVALLSTTLSSCAGAVCTGAFRRPSARATRSAFSAAS